MKSAGCTLVCGEYVCGAAYSEFCCRGSTDEQITLLDITKCGGGGGSGGGATKAERRSFAAKPINGGGGSWSDNDRSD